MPGTGWRIFSCIQPAYHYERRVDTPLWHDIRQYINKEQPLAAEIIRIASIFHACGLKPYKNLIRSIVIVNLIQNGSWLNIFKSKHKINCALNYLLNFDIVSGTKTIVAPEVALIKMDCFKSHVDLAKWLIDHDTLLYKALLKYYFSAFDEYNKTLLVMEKSGQEHPSFDQNLQRRLKSRKDAFFKKVAAEMDNFLQTSIQNFFCSKVWGKEFKISNSKMDYLVQQELEPSEELCSQGFRYLESGSKSEALESFRNAIASSPNTYYARLGLSRLFWEWGQHNEAIEECKKALKINPSIQEGYHFLGFMLTSRYEFDDAEFYFNKSLELNSIYTPSIIGLSKILLLKEEPKSALDLLKNYHNKLPNLQVISSTISWLKILLSDNSTEHQSEECLKLILAYLPELTEKIIHTNNYDLEISLKDAKLIVSYLLKEDVEDVEEFELIDMFLLYAELNIVEGHVEKAVSILQKAIEYYPNLFGVYIFLGNTYTLAKLHEDALEIYNRAVYIKPNDIKTLIGQANALISIGKSDKSLSLIFKAIEIDPYSSEARFILSACYQILGYDDKVIEQLDNIANLESLNLNNYNKARIEALQGNVENAIGLLDAALSEDIFLISTIQTDPCFKRLLENPNLSNIVEKHRFNALNAHGAENHLSNIGSRFEEHC